MRSADDEFSDPAAERAVLSAILLDERQSRGTYALAATVIRVQAERRDDGLAVGGDFADPRHNLIFAAMGDPEGELAERMQAAYTLELRGRAMVDAAMGAKLVEPGEPMPELTALDLAVAELGRIRAARDASGRRTLIEGGVGTAFGCTIQGEVKESEVLRLMQALLDAGCDRVSLADTVGYADPAQVQRLFEKGRNAAQRWWRPLVMPAPMRPITDFMDNTERRQWQTSITTEPQATTSWTPRVMKRISTTPVAGRAMTASLAAN